MDGGPYLFLAVVMKEPESQVQSTKGRKNAHKFLNGRFLRVTYREEADHILIITVTVRETSFKR
jgi:hypothetical protein